MKNNDEKNKFDPSVLKKYIADFYASLDLSKEAIAPTLEGHKVSDLGRMNTYYREFERSAKISPKCNSNFEQLERILAGLDKQDDKKFIVYSGLLVSVYLGDYLKSFLKSLYVKKIYYYWLLGVQSYYIKASISDFLSNDPSENSDIGSDNAKQSEPSIGYLTRLCQLFQILNTDAAEQLLLKKANQTSLVPGQPDFTYSPKAEDLETPAARTELYKKIMNTPLGIGNSETKYNLTKPLIKIRELLDSPDGVWLGMQNAYSNLFAKAIESGRHPAESSIQNVLKLLNIYLIEPDNEMSYSRCVYYLTSHLWLALNTSISDQLKTILNINNYLKFILRTIKTILLNQNQEYEQYLVSVENLQLSLSDSLTKISKELPGVVYPYTSESRTNIQISCSEYLDRSYSFTSKDKIDGRTPISTMALDNIQSLKSNVRYPSRANFTTLPQDINDEVNDIFRCRETFEKLITLDGELLTAMLTLPDLVSLKFFKDCIVGGIEEVYLSQYCSHLDKLALEHNKTKDDKTLVKHSASASTITSSPSSSGNIERKQRRSLLGSLFAVINSPSNSSKAAVDTAITDATSEPVNRGNRSMSVENNANSNSLHRRSHSVGFNMGNLNHLQDTASDCSVSKSQ